MSAGAQHCPHCGASLPGAEAADVSPLPSASPSPADGAELAEGVANFCPSCGRRVVGWRTGVRAALGGATAGGEPLAEGEAPTRAIKPTPALLEAVARTKFEPPPSSRPKSGPHTTQKIDRTARESRLSQVLRQSRGPLLIGVTLVVGVGAVLLAYMYNPNRHTTPPPPPQETPVVAVAPTPPIVEPPADDANAKKKKTHHLSAPPIVEPPVKQAAAPPPLKPPPIIAPPTPPKKQAIAPPTTAAARDRGHGNPSSTAKKGGALPHKAVAGDSRGTRRAATHDRVGHGTALGRGAERRAAGREQRDGEGRAAITGSGPRRRIRARRGRRRALRRERAPAASAGLLQ